MPTLSICLKLSLLGLLTACSASPAQPALLPAQSIPTSSAISGPNTEPPTPGLIQATPARQPASPPVSAIQPGLVAPTAGDKPGSATDFPETPITPANVADVRLISEFELPQPVEAVAFSPDGQVVAASSSAGVGLWNVVDGTLLHTLTGARQGAFYNQVIFEPDGSRMFVTEIFFGEGEPGQMLGWNLPVTAPDSPDYHLSQGEFECRLGGEECDPLWTNRVSPTGLALGIYSPPIDADHWTGVATVVIKSTPPITLTFPAAANESVEIAFLGFNHAGTMFALSIYVQSHDGQPGKSMLHLYRQDGTLVDSHLTDRISGDVVFSADDRLFAYPTGASIELWRVDNQGLEWISRTEPQTFHIINFQFTPDSQMVIAWRDGGATFYRVDTGAALKLLPAVPTITPDPRDPRDGGVIHGLAIGPRGRAIAIISAGKVQIWGVR